MERLEKIDIYNIIESLTGSNMPLKEALSMNKRLDGRTLYLVFREAMTSGNMIVANAIYKTIILEKFHRVNYFIGLCYEGNYSEYLSGLSIAERKDLLDDFIFKIEMLSGSPEDKEAFEILVDSLKDSKLYTKKNGSII